MSGNLKLHVKTNQGAFNRVVRQLAKQGSPAHDGISCVYFDPRNGNRCAAGVLFDSHRLGPTEQGRPFDSLVAEGYVDLDSTKIDEGLVTSLQAWHDHSDNWNGGLKGGFSPVGVRRLAEIARLHNLSAKVLDELEVV